MQPTSTAHNLLDSLKCPLTFELFEDPVIGSDGYTYERENITQWLKKHGKSPVTHQPMELSSLRSNYTVKKLVDDFLSSSLQKQHQYRLDIDVAKAHEKPLFKSATKNIYEGRWISKFGPSIVLIEIIGTKAKREASFYFQLSCHPHIVRTYGLIESEQSNGIMLVQEYAPHGDLVKILRENRFQPTEQVWIEIFYQIANALVCLADNQIIHGDLACRNVLVFRLSSDQPSNILVKLTDFGLTRTGSLFTAIDSIGSSAFNLIPVRSAAPEILVDAASAVYSEKSDVYSFGVLIWEALSKGAVPFGHFKKLDDVYQEKKNGLRLERPNDCPAELWDLASQCMLIDPEHRPRFQDIQESLLRLKFQNERFSVEQNPSLLISSDSRRRSDQTNTDSTRNFKTRTIPKIDEYENQKFILPDNIPNNVYINLPSTIQTPNPTSGYSKICGYCSQTYNTSDSNQHQSFCRIRCSVQRFIESAAQTPWMVIISCPNCKSPVPRNMIDTHQSSCDGQMKVWVNTFETMKFNSSAETSIDYLNPIEPTEVRIRTNNGRSDNQHNERTSRPPSYNSIHNHKEFSHAEVFPSLALENQKKSEKHSKSGFFKTLSRIRKKNVD